MEITKEKLAYLLFLYKQKETNCTVTRLAEEFGVSKSTFSRVLNIFYHENLIIQKGKGILLSLIHILPKLINNVGLVLDK